MSHVVPQIECGEALCQFWAIFVPLLHFWSKKSKFSKNEKKRLEILSFYILLGVLLNVGVKKYLRKISNWDQNKFNKKGVKINVGVRIFQ